MMIISDPELVTQSLDRQLYPEFIDKPSFYSIINQVQATSTTFYVLPPHWYE